MWGAISFTSSLVKVLSGATWRLWTLRMRTNLPMGASANRIIVVKAIEREVLHCNWPISPSSPGLRM